MQKLVVPISNRTNYSKLRPVLKLLSNFEVILSSSIILEKYGNPEKDIIADGFPIVDRVDCLLMNDSPESMSKTCSVSMMCHSQIYSKIQPKAILATGDRFDMLPAVLSAHMMNIPILHIQGGEQSGSIDNSIRDIITVCSKEHYVSTQKSFDRVKLLTNSSIYLTGCPAVEYISEIPVGEYLNVNSLYKKYKHDINLKPSENYLLIFVHPSTTDHENIMDDILKVCTSFDMKCVLFYPNADAFNSDILTSIRQFADKLILIKHAPVEDFVKFMAHAKCMIGNSSSGIREAASFGTPVVNVGSRQEFRERNVNTIDVPYCSNFKNEIYSAVKHSIEHGKYNKENIYYKKMASKNIADLVTSFMSSL